MQALQLYTIGKQAYNGNKQAKQEWFKKLSKIAIQIGSIYKICPSLILCKAVIESGWGTDLYQEQLEKQFSVKMQRKAQKHNNLMGMNAFELNCKYLNNFPKTKWNQYKTIFEDYGPHIHNNKYVLTPNEPWKSFINIQDCFEDWAANMRFQAQYHNKKWGNSLKQQLIAIESYTPQGQVATSEGMHFSWQDDILKLYNDFNLQKYDKEAITDNMSTVKLTTANLDQHIKKAYEYAHNHNCKYGPTDRYFPPMEDNYADCVGLALRAFYTMGYNNGRKNINNILKLCEDAGMTKSTDINDVWKYHGIVCMQDKVNAGSLNVGHVYYSLGGTSINNISKYDLGSNERITANQPFHNVRVNEWIDRRNFMCFYYIKETVKTKKTPIPKYKSPLWTKGQIKKRVGIYEGPGSGWNKLGILEIGTLVDFSPRITNENGKDWRRVRTIENEKIKYDGYVYSSSVGGMPVFKAYKSKVKNLGNNDFAALRIGPGIIFNKIDELKSGTNLTVQNSIINNNELWLYVTIEETKKKGYVSATLIE